MTKFNRNVITQDDIVRLQSAAGPADVPKSFDTNPPAGAAGLVGATAVPGALAAAGDAGGGPPAGAPGGAQVPSEDDYLTKLLKFVPLEVVGAYLFIAGVVDSNVTKPHDHAIWLGVLLLTALLITIPYDIRVLGIVRGAQITLSVIGLAVYVFAVGGWFATTTWYQHWYASIALPAFGLLAAIIKLKPLPTAG